MTQRYYADPDRVVAEELAHEVMVVDLDTGYYYVLDGAGANLWPMLARGVPAADATAALQLRDPTANAIGEAVEELVRLLVDEGLLIPLPEGVDPEPLPELPTAPTAFVAPTMTKYVDMANLVQMDPIRDFEERRWPSKWRFGGTD